jgi:phage terminase large subunit
MKVEYLYKPRKWAKKLHNSKKLYNVIVAHRRAGKTVAALNHLILECFKNPDKNKRYAFICPTFKQAKDIAWDTLKLYASQIPHTKFNEAELRCDFPNKSRITLYGSENVDSLRGRGLWGVVFDEYSQQPSNIFSEIISKCLADHLGFSIWIGTPKGKNAFYDLLLTAEKYPDRYFSLRYTIDDSFTNETGKTIDNLKVALENDRQLVKDGVMGIDEFEQEWYCSFEAATKGAYYQEQIRRLREDGRLTNVPWISSQPVHTWWDLGVGDSTSIGFFQHIGQEWHLIDYYESHGEGLQHYINVLQSKPYVYGEHYAPHDIEVRELGTGKSRKEMAQGLGLFFQVAPNLPIDDGINALRSRFNTLWIDKNCSQVIDLLAQYRKEWDEKMGQFKNKPVHDFTSHCADMLRYWAVCEDFSDVIVKTKY